MRRNDGMAFEKETARRLRALGWVSAHTPRTRDFGADLLARVRAHVMVVQCKDHHQPTSFSAVQEAHTAASLYNASMALVVSRNGFTVSARQASLRLGVVLLQISDLKEGCEVDFRAERKVARSEDLARAAEARRVREKKAAERARLKENEAVEGAELARKWKELERAYEQRIAAEQIQADALTLWSVYDREIARIEQTSKIFQHRWIILSSSAVAAIFASLNAGPDLHEAAWAAGLAVTTVMAWVLFVGCKPRMLPLQPSVPRPDQATATPAPDEKKSMAAVDDKGKQPQYPSRPSDHTAHPNGRVAVRCDVCRTILMLPRGRSGFVSCPSCSSRTFARTDSVLSNH